MKPRALILGCGYTGQRVAELLINQGWEVTVTSRDVSRLSRQKARVLHYSLGDLPPPVTRDTAVLYSIPSATSAIADAISPARSVVFLSTTGVYGSQPTVNERSEPAPETERQTGRYQSELVLRAAIERLVILRPAAIYGPSRGIHWTMRQGAYRLPGRGGNYVSRVHVDDLAAICVAALTNPVAGAWPVADREPCTALAMAEFCANLLGLPMPAPGPITGGTRSSDRRVDGSAILRELEVELRYPSYRAGVPACVEAEASERAR